MTQNLFLVSGIASLTEGRTKNVQSYVNFVLTDSENEAKGATVTALQRSMPGYVVEVMNAQNVTDIALGAAAAILQSRRAAGAGVDGKDGRSGP